MKKHVWAILLAMLLVIGLMPAALAEETQQTGLMFREAYWNEYDELELNPTLNNGWEAAPGDETLVKFFYVTEENPDGVEVALEELAFSGISAEYYEGTDFIYIMVEEFGDCTVSYEADGQTHTLVISSVLPHFGFYSEPEISEETYLPRLTLTELGQTVYFLVGEGATVSTINIGGFGAFADLTQISETCWQITITGRPWFRDGNYGLPITGTYNGEEVSGGAMLRILDQMPGLVFRYAFHDGETFVEDESDYFHGIMEEAVISEPVVRFYFYDGEENYEPIPAGEVTDTESVRVYEENDELARLSFTALGEHYVSYERDGEEYSLLVNLLMPDFGFYTEPFVSEETLIRREFEVTAENNTIYFIVNNDPNDENYNYGQIFDLELMGHFAEIAEATPYTNPEDGPVTCWEITINGRARSGEWYDVCYSGVNPWGEHFEEYWEGLHLFDNSPALVVRYLDHDGENWYENEENHFEYELHMALNHRPVVRVYFFDGENYYPVDPDALIPNDAVEVNRIEGTDFVEIAAGEWGWNSIGYEFEGEIYELPICVELPGIGFYREPVASEENYIVDLAVGGEGAVCYVIAIHDITLSDVHLVDEFIDVATSEPYGENCWKITFTGEVEDDHWYRIYCDGADGGGEFYEREESIHVMNTAPRLVIRQIEENEDGFFEHPDWDMHTEWAPAINHYVPVRVYFFDGENYIPVDPTALGCSGSVELQPIEGTEFVRIVPTSWGDGAILYEHEDGNTYELPVHIVLPTFGFYTTPYASEDSYIWELTMSGESAEVYFIAINDAMLYSVEPIYGFEEIAYAEYVDDFCWKITINGSFEDGRYYDIFYTGFEPWSGEFERQDGLHICMDEHMPRLMLRDLAMDENGNWYEEESWGLYRDWYGPIGNRFYVRVYFFDGENYYPVDPDDLYSDGAVAINRVDDTDYVEFTTNAWGDHTVYYEYGGETYSLKLHVQLADFGFYSSEEASEETYLTEFHFNDENRVFYFVAAHGATLSRVTLNGDHDTIADIEYISDTCYRITITDAFESGYWLDVSFDGTESNGNPVENWGQGICLMNWDPDAEILAQAEAMGLLQYLEVYDLNATLSRLDAAKLMAAMLDVAPIPDAELPFTDCDDLTQEEKDIVAAIVDTGIIKGIAEGTFDPYGTLTRAQLATMIYRALGEPETENSVNAPETVWYLKAVLALQDLGIITDENITTNAGEIIQIRDALEWMIRAKAILGSGGIRPGDLNGDDEVNTRDVIVLLDAIAAIGTGEWSEDLRAAADVNGDGRISVRDAIIILDSIAARTTNEL